MPHVAEEIAAQAQRRGVPQGVLVEEAWELYKQRTDNLNYRITCPPEMRLTSWRRVDGEFFQREISAIRNLLGFNDYRRRSDDFQ
jgi:hypothetical protein